MDNLAILDGLAEKGVYSAYILLYCTSEKGTIMATFEIGGNDPYLVRWQRESGLTETRHNLTLQELLIVVCDKLGFEATQEATAAFVQSLAENIG